jgi:hypothetical protein
MGYFIINSLTIFKKCGILHANQGGERNASILYEVPRQEGYEGCEADYHEEW